MPLGRLVAVAIARAVVVASGLAVVAWSWQTAQLTWRHLGLSDAATRVGSRESFKSELIERLRPQLDAVDAESVCAPSAFHDATMIRLRLAETAIVDGQSSAIDPALRRLEATARKSLQCSPMDPMLWLALYWVDIQLNGVRSGAVAPLEISYRLGPNEGWIALARSRFGLAAWDYVSAPTREAILNEERALLDAGFTQQVAANLVAVGWPIHDRILARLGDAAAASREALARRLRHDGYDIAVPGIALEERRPWN
jgi:hypothetical protein